MLDKTRHRMMKDEKQVTQEPKAASNMAPDVQIESEELDRANAKCLDSVKRQTTKLQEFVRQGKKKNARRMRQKLMRIQFNTQKRILAHQSLQQTRKVLALKEQEFNEAMALGNGEASDLSHSSEDSEEESEEKAEEPESMALGNGEASDLSHSSEDSEEESEQKAEEPESDVLLPLPPYAFAASSVTSLAPLPPPTKWFYE
jgi:hypothetical protein